jgi:hypothetical protein
MNCQPSFRTGSVPLVGPARDELGWSWPALRDGIPDRHASGAAGPKRERPHRRVPDCDIVDVGTRARAVRDAEPVDVRDLAFVDAKASAVRPSTPASIGRRTYTKPLLALLILQVTVVGCLYLKKRHAESQVIVIPATVNERSVIT